MSDANARILVLENEAAQYSTHLNELKLINENFKTSSNEDKVENNTVRNRLTDLNVIILSTFDFNFLLNFYNL